MTDRVLVVVAHPDDMEFLAGGTVAKMVDEGADVRELIVTNGERGSFELGGEELARERRKEAQKAASVLGVRSVSFLGYPDGMLADFRFNEIREKIMKHIRTNRSNAIITWDPFAPYETHQDHRITGMAATEAAGFASLPLYHPEQVQTDADLPTVSETYYIAKTHLLPNHVVDISPYIGRKIEALCCHRTQMEFTVAGIRKALEARGAPPESYEAIDPRLYRSFIDAAVRRHDSEIGKRIGSNYAEEFRLSRRDDMEQFLELGRDQKA